MTNKNDYVAPPGGNNNDYVAPPSGNNNSDYVAPPQVTNRNMVVPTDEYEYVEEEYYVEDSHWADDLSRGIKWTIFIVTMGTIVWLSYSWLDSVIFKKLSMYIRSLNIVSLDTSNMIAGFSILALYVIIAWLIGGWGLRLMPTITEVKNKYTWFGVIGTLAIATIIVYLVIAAIIVMIIVIFGLLYFASKSNEIKVKIK